MYSPVSFKGTYCKSINKSRVSDGAQTPSRNNSPKMFLYPEAFEIKISPKAFPKSPNNLSKLLGNLHSKFKNKKLELPSPQKHCSTAKKNQTPTFIEKIRLELEAKCPKSKIKHGRSLSQSKQNKKYQKPEKNSPGTLTLLNHLNIRNLHLRKDSFPECSIDFQKLDLPYAQNYLKSLYYKPDSILPS
jgi:hypothetical protein